MKIKAANKGQKAYIVGPNRMVGGMEMFMLRGGNISAEDKSVCVEET